MNGWVPRYQQIADALRDQIRRGDLTPGARLDTQRALARRFEVTLMTLRQALEMLEREQLIERRHGLGTFVATPSIDYDILQLRRLAADLSAQGEDVTTRVLGVRFVTPSAATAATLLCLPPHSRVLQLERLRLVGGRPMSLQRSLLPAHASARRWRRPISASHPCTRFSSSSSALPSSEPRRACRPCGCPLGLPASWAVIQGWPPSNPNGCRTT